MYSNFYKARQHENSKCLPREWYLDAARSLPWVRQITIKKSTVLDRARVRGLIFASDRHTTGGIDSLNYTILIADGMAPDYERFVTIKELMHCYFSPAEGNVRYLTDTQFLLENHMNAFFGNATTPSPQNEAEKMALWMAIGVLCTEHDRQTIISGIKAQTTNIQTESAALQVPETQVKALVSKVFDEEIKKLIV